MGNGLLENVVWRLRDHGTFGLTTRECSLGKRQAGSSALAVGLEVGGERSTCEECGGGTPHRQ
jgi:hypothetical protein